MKQITSLTLIPALALLSVTPLFGQSPAEVIQDDAGTKQAEPEYKVPTFVKAGVGFRAVVNNEAGEQLATIQDHIIDRASGKIRFIVLSAAGDEGDLRSLLAPYQSFTWNASKKELQLRLTAEELQALPEFDATKVQSLGAGKMAEAGKKALDKAGDMTGDVKEASMSKLNVLHLTSTTLLGSDIVAMDENFSAVGDLLIEPNAGTLAFVLARDTAGMGDPYIIPFKALTWEASKRAVAGAELEGGRFVLAMTPDALIDAPKLRGGETASLKDKATITGIYRFYKLSAPEFDAKVSGRRER